MKEVPTKMGYKGICFIFLFLVTWTIKLVEYTSGKSWMKYWVTLPIIMLFFDFLENIGHQ